MLTKLFSSYVPFLRSDDITAINIKHPCPGNLLAYTALCLSMMITVSSHFAIYR